jgi:hypothetical protein
MSNVLGINKLLLTATGAASSPERAAPAPAGFFPVPKDRPSKRGNVTLRLQQRLFVRIYAFYSIRKATVEYHQKL